jgi:hypothetical protein
VVVHQQHSDRLGVRCRGAVGGFGAALLVQVDLPTHPCTPARRALHVQPPTHQAHPLLHAGQPEAAAVSRVRLGRVEPEAVVRDQEAELSGTAGLSVL